MPEEQQTSIPARSGQEFIGRATLWALAVFVAGFMLWRWPSGSLGVDYQQQFPNLLAGYYWFSTNGIFATPWFTPAECGGLPFFADPGHGLYSLPTLLVFVFDPVVAIKITFVVFALAGYFGFYLLLENIFEVTPPLALLGALLFALNGFYTAHMIIGHPFHAFMLVPWLAYFVLTKRMSLLTGTALGGAVIAYMFHSAMLHLILPAICVVTVMMLFHQIRFGFDPKMWLRFALSGVWGLGLSLSKLSATLAFLHNFPRAFYLLPGFSYVSNAALTAFKSVFFSVSAVQVNALLSNKQFYFGQYELDFSVTPVPLVLIVVGLGWWTFRYLRGGTRPGASTAAALTVAGLVFAAPIILNWYAPAWNAFLKKLPLLGQSSNLIRWFVLYIPLSILLAVLAAEKTFREPRTVVAIAVLSAGIAIYYHTQNDYALAQAERYDPRAIQEAFSKRTVRPIKAVVAYLNQNGTIAMPVGRNDALVIGASQLACYNAMFGYRLEAFPGQDLHAGPATVVRKGHFNMKNPACYVFPTENGCAPGDHFRETEREKLEAFLEYKPFEFRKSSWQEFADAINGIVIAFFAIVALRTLWLRATAPQVRSRGY